MNVLETAIHQLDHLDRELLRITRYSERINRAIKETIRCRIVIFNLLKTLEVS